MSVEAVLRNIYSYLEVLEAAHSKAVRHWAENSLQNALKWAQYCEQIYGQSCGKSYSKNLDEQIRKLNCKPWNLGGCYIHLGLLKEAKHHLTYALLQNPYLDAALYGHVVRACLDTGQDAFVKTCSSLIQPKLVRCIADTVKDALIPSQRLSNSRCKDRSCSSTHTEVSSLLLYQYLSHVTRTVPKGPRTDAAIRMKLHNICDEANGFEVLLRCLHLAYTEQQHNNNNDNTSDLDMVATLTAHLVDVLDTDSTNRCIRSTPVDLFTKVAAHSVSFFSCYMRRLVAEAELLTLPVTSSDETTVIQRRTPPSGAWTYGEWFSHLEALQSAGGPVSRAVKQSVEQLSKTSDSLVWDQARRELLTR